MLTNDKTICNADYWNRIYSGKNMNAKVDSSNTVRPAKVFDRFDIVVKHAEGPRILGIASGHAHIEKRIKAAHPDWMVTASDQADEARKVANFEPYLKIDAYDIPFVDKSFDTVICCQALEYMDDQERFIQEAKRVSNSLLITVPEGNMSSWSQLRIYTSENLMTLLDLYGVIEVFEKHPSLLLAKVRFHD